MMKNSKLLLAVCTMLLVFGACGNAPKQNSNEMKTEENAEPMAQEMVEQPVAPESEGTYTEVPEPEIFSPIAYDVFRIILVDGLNGIDPAMAEFLEGRKDYEGVDELVLNPQHPDGNVTYYQYSDDYEDDWTVKCYPLKHGGWAVLVEVFYIVGDWGPSQYFAYRYVDGDLTPAPDLLPNPKFNDIYSEPAMLEGLSEERIALLKQSMDGDDNDGVPSFDNYKYYLGLYDAPFVVILGCQDMDMSDAYFENNDFQFAKTVYFWNGERFEKVCPVEGFAYGDCTDGDEAYWVWNGERFVTEPC